LRLSLDPEVVEALEAACPEDFAEDRRLKALESCLEELPPKAREIIRLRYHHEHGPGEIGRLLSRSVNSINVALSRSRVALRECIEQKLQLTDPS
jgi:RNA polymerase sigma-70 factor (ECF subfamily)